MLHKPVVNSIDLKDLTTETCFLKADTTLLLKSYGLGGRDYVRLISRVFNALGRRKFAAVRKQSRYFLGCAHASYPIQTSTPLRQRLFHDIVISPESAVNSELIGSGINSASRFEAKDGYGPVWISERGQRLDQHPYLRPASATCPLRS